MKPQFAYDAIVLEYGGNTVFLRPSLRAAIHLEQLHGGFAQLLRKIEEFDTLTIWHVITAAAGREACEPLFAHAANQPLRSFQQAAQVPCLNLVASLFPEAPDDAEQQAGGADPTPWDKLLKSLYGFATGWMGWTPETAWTATPQEITDAFNAHVSKLKALHGEADDDAATSQTEAQRQANIDLGLDADFDRTGLHSLREYAAMREGMAI